MISEACDLLIFATANAAEVAAASATAAAAALLQLRRLIMKKMWEEKKKERNEKSWRRGIKNLGGQNKGASAETFNSQVRGCRVPG